jgi:hypothetical protein
MAAKHKGWIPPREGGYKATARKDKSPTVGSKPVPPKGGSGVSQPTKTTKE